MPNKKGYVQKLDFSADGKTLVAIGNVLIVWDLPTGKQRFPTRFDRHGLSALAISADGKLIACESRKHAVCLFDAATGKELHFFGGHRAHLSALAFSPDGKMLVSGSCDATALVWDMTTLKATDAQK